MSEVNQFILEDLVIWLEKREEDIAYDIEDFGELKHIFRALVKREPETQPMRIVRELFEDKMREGTTVIYSSKGGDSIKGDKHVICNSPMIVKVEK